MIFVKRNPKHTENLNDHHKEPDKDISTLFPKARKENIFSTQITDPRLQEMQNSCPTLLLLLPYV